MPRHSGKVKRSSGVEVSYIDVEGKQRTMRAGGYYAGLLQHEIDHLHGRLFIDVVEKHCLYYMSEFNAVADLVAGGDDGQCMWGAFEIE